MSSKEYVVEFAHAREDGSLTFDVWEHARPSRRARFAISPLELMNATSASMLMATRIKMALEQVRNM